MMDNQTDIQVDSYIYIFCLFSGGIMNMTYLFIAALTKCMNIFQCVESNILITSVFIKPVQ